MFGAYPIIMIVVSAAALFVAISAALWFSSGAETSQALPLTALTKSPTKLNCTDKHPTCEYDAQRGECESNPSWMIFNCPKACNACELLDTKIRCSRKRMNISDEPVYLPGDMDHMFREIIPRFQHAYDIEVLSESPWIVLFNNFLTDLEADAFIQTVNGRWQRSKAVASQQLNEFGAPPTAVSENRTSSQAWCQEGCREDWRIHSVIRKIEHVVGIPYSHYEDFQVLRYENGQYYKEHHDMGEFQLALPSGPRILTFFMYLSDIEEGGETSFPRLGIKVKPKRGSALLWPNTLSDDVLKQDPRTHHESVPVLRGTKYAANSWIHAYDFSASLIWGCTGSSREN